MAKNALPQLVVKDSFRHKVLQALVDSHAVSKNNLVSNYYNDRGSARKVINRMIDQELMTEYKQSTNRNLYVMITTNGRALLQTSKLFWKEN